MEEQISKKDLLKLTGISYGQLYRWKREKLIPEDWFHKQSSVTGQETYFPKEAILKRVKRILELKDQYSLEELAEMLSPEFVNRLFHEDELDQFSEIHVDVAAQCMDVLEKDMFSFREIIWMCVLSHIYDKITLEEDDQKALFSAMLDQLEQLPTLEHTFLLWKFHEHTSFCLYANNAKPAIDARLQVLCELDLQEMTNQMKIKYQSVFHFTFD